MNILDGTYDYVSGDNQTVVPQRPPSNAPEAVNTQLPAEVHKVADRASG